MVICAVLMEEVRDLMAVHKGLRFVVPRGADLMLQGNNVKVISTEGLKARENVACS